MVIYDGEYLVVSVSKANYKSIVDLAKKYDGEYLGEMKFTFPPTRTVAWELEEMGCHFDDSAKMFLKKRKHPVGFQDLELPDCYFDFQKDNIRNMISNKRNILLADDTGTGKTVSLSGYLKYANDAYPCLIICPSIIKTNWKKEIKNWCDKDAVVINGMNSFQDEELLSQVKNAEVVVINYDLLGVENQEQKMELATLKKKKKKWEEEFDETDNVLLGEKIKNIKQLIKRYKVDVEGWCDELSKIRFHTIICDEAHKICSDKAIRTRCVQKICGTQNCKIICASATPFETQPSQFFTILNLLCPDMFSEKWAFLYRYCAPVKTHFGWEFNGLSNGEEFRNKLLKFMYRHKMDDVLPELPPLNTQAIYIDVEPKHRKIYDRMDEEYINVPSEEKSAYIVKLKQELSKAKLPSCMEWIEDYLESGKKLVVATFFTETFDTLMEHFKKICVGINGQTSRKKRDEAIDKFQNDDKIRLFIGQVEAANVGITLTASDTVCFLELGKTVGGMVQMAGRCRRIGQKSDKCNAVYLLLDDSIDDDRVPVLLNRDKNSQFLLDGKVGDTFMDLDDAIRINWAKRHQQE